MRVIHNPLSQFALVGAFSFVIFLTGCNDIDQDTPANAGTSIANTIYNGVTAEGYIANSTVFFDNNNNGALDAWEPFAYTDSNGYLSYNPLTNTDYCAANASEVEQQYCLQTKQNFDSVIMRINGGISSTSVRPVGGQLSRTIENVDANTAVTPVVSPFTSLMTHLDTAQHQQLLQLLGLSSELIDINYLNLPLQLSDGSSADGVYTDLAMKAMLIHKVVVVINHYFTQTYPDLGAEVGMPYDASNMVYKSLAQRLLENNLDIVDAVAYQPLISQVIQDVEQDVMAVYQEFELALPAGISLANQQNISSGLVVLPEVMGYLQAIPVNNVASVKSFMQMIDEVIWQFLNDETIASGRQLSRTQVMSKEIDARANRIDFGDVLADLKVILTTALPTFDTTTITSEMTDDGLVFSVDNEDLEDQVLENTVDTTITELVASISTMVMHDAEGESKIAALAANTDTSALNSFVEQASTLQDEIDTLPTFEALDGKTIRIADDDLGTTNSQNDREIELYFAADGKLAACAKKVEDYSGGELGLDDFWGKFGEGSYSVVGDDNRTLSIIYEVEDGAKIQGYFSILPSETVNGVEKFAYKGAFSASDGNESLVFYSEQGLTDSVSSGETPPTTDTECEERLGSRIMR